MLKKIFYLIIVVLSGLNNIFCQNLPFPNSAMKSHETLEIKSIELNKGKTVVNLEIENRVQGGNFCADKNIYISDQTGKRFKLISAQNIPVCPEVYLFKSIGEKLSFTLEFPQINSGTEWIDIIEDCPENCFWFYGVTLDPGLNRRLNDLFEEASKSRPEDNILLFRRFLEDVDNRNHGIEGLLYINIINASTEAGDKVEASVWYRRLLSSGAPRVNYYVKYLNDRGIKY